MDKREYARAWYAKHRDEQLPKARARMLKYRSLNMRVRQLLLSARPCVDCGEPPCPDTPLEFDHREGIGQKAQRRISNLVTKGTSVTRMLKEIEKCDVVCPTCHKARTYHRSQWKRVKYYG